MAKDKDTQKQTPQNPPLILVMLKKLLGGAVMLYGILALFGLWMMLAGWFSLGRLSIWDFIMGFSFSFVNWDLSVTCIIALATYNHYIWKLYKNYIKSKIKHKLARFIIISIIILMAIPLCFGCIEVYYDIQKWFRAIYDFIV